MESGGVQKIHLDAFLDVSVVYQRYTYSYIVDILETQIPPTGGVQANKCLWLLVRLVGWELGRKRWSAVAERHTPTTDRGAKQAMNPETISVIENAIAYETKRQGCPPPGFPELKEVPGGRYTQQSFYDLEKVAAWRQSWVCVGLEADVKNPGDYKCLEKLDAPIILVRGMDNTLRAFMNTCRHRGARLTKDDHGNVRHLRCQYHSWSYKLTGELMGVPEERDFSNLNKAEKGAEFALTV